MISRQLRNVRNGAAHDELIWSIMHKMNNGLTAVGLRIESLLAEVQEEDPRRYKLRALEHEMERLSSFLNNALQVAVPSEGPFRVIDVSREMEKALELVQFHLLIRGVTVVREISSKLPPILGDSQKLRRLFFHLFVRIIGESNRGDAVVVRVQGTKEDNGVASEYLVVEIGRHGRNRSRRSKSAKSTPMVREGTFGEWPNVLALCTSIAKGHKGRLQYETRSDVQCGKVMRVALPVALC